MPTRRTAKKKTTKRTPAKRGAIKRGKSLKIPRETPINVSPTKARKILKDGKIRGKKLTQKQKRFFGMMAAR